jgi:hypothetical protein
MPATQDFKFLGFFNKDGIDLNFSYDSTLDMWTGTLNLPEVSKGLYETATIVLLEQFLNTGGITKWGIPHFSDPTYNPTEPIDSYSWSAFWEDETDENDRFILFTFDLTADKPILNVVEQAIVEVDIDVTETVNSAGEKITNVITNKGIQFNIALKSDTEGVYERYLIIKENGTDRIIARIKFYGEVIGEDERLTVLIQNLGYSLYESDYSVFRNSDINEQLPDYKILNEKRKELLLEGKNIQPFIGSYKGIINAIKFFGYNNIKLKEYWLNVDSESQNYGKYKTTTVIDIFDKAVNVNDESVYLPNKIYKKTALFSLVYRINEMTGFLDEYDIPTVTESTDFTLEEALIKLYGLKEVLRKRYLPSTSRIIDIIGEADYFGKITTSVWSDQQRIDNLNIGITPRVEVTPRSGYIQDLRPVIELFAPEFQPYFLNRYSTVGDSDLGNRIVENISPVLLAYFDKYGPNLNTISKLPDKPGIPVGMPVVLENKSFVITWDQAEATWDEIWANGSLILNFTPSDVGISDEFRITNTTTGQYISYVALSGDGPAQVAAGLLSSLQTAKNTGDGKPWIYFSGSLADLDNSSSFETLRLRQIIGGNFGIDLQPSATDGGLFGNNPVLTKTFESSSTLLCWDTFGQQNFYEMEWHVFKNQDETPAFEYSVRGNISLYNTITLNLPYTGFYNVELRLYDTYNNMSSKIWKDHIQVISKEPEFIGFYKFREREYTWNSIYNMKKLQPISRNTSLEELRRRSPRYTWDEYGSSWELPIAPASIYFDAGVSLYESLDRSNYILNNSNPDLSLSYHYTNPDVPVYNLQYTPGPYFWDNLGGCTWDETYHLWWQSCKISGDTPANFRIYSVSSGSSMAMEQRYPRMITSQYFFSSSNLDAEADALNNTDDPVFGKFVYNKVYSLNATEPVLEFVQAVAKKTSQNGDWVNFTWSDGIDIRYNQLTEINNPTYNDIRFLTDAEILPRLTHVTFTYDLSKIPGKDMPRWTLKNLDSSGTDDIYFTGRWFTYLFKRKGRYELNLQLQDANGNQSKVTKNILIIK